MGKVLAKARGVKWSPYDWKNSIEYSHAIPKRVVGKRFKNSPFNRDYVTMEEHALMDHYRYGRMVPQFKNEYGNSIPNRGIQLWNRIPKVYKGAATGALYSAASNQFGIGSDDCECQK